MEPIYYVVFKSLGYTFVFSLTDGSDFILQRNEVTFDLGANDGNTISLIIDILDDRVVEGTETFTLSGSVVTTGTIATFEGGPATVTILDDDSK